MNKRFVASFTLAAFATLAVPVAAMPASSQASLTAKGGKVLTKVADGRWNDVSSEILQAGAQVRTGTDGTAILRLSDDSIVRLAPNTQITVGQDSAVVLERGRLLGSTDAGLRIDTSKTTTQASTGEFVVQTTSTGTELNVLSGNAKLNSKDSEPVWYGIENAAAEIFSTDTLSDVQIYGDVSLVDSQDPVETVTTEPEAVTAEPVTVAQEGDPAEPSMEEQEEEAKKGNVWKNGGWVFVGVGAAVILIIALAEGDEEKPFPEPPSASTP